MPEIFIGHGRQSALLISIHSSFRRFHGMCGACLDFDKTQHFIVPGNQVNLSPPA